MSGSSPLLDPTFADEFNSLNLYDPTTGLGVWSPYFPFGNPEGPKSLLAHTILPDELEIYVDPTYGGSGLAPLGLNPFSINNGILDITAQRTPDLLKPLLFNYGYTSGILTTGNSFTQTYGYFEMRAALPTDNGVWSGFWMERAGNGPKTELDVMENVGGGAVYSTAHYNVNGSPKKTSFFAHVDDTTAFHTYGMLWTAKTISWYIDGVETASMATPAGLNQPMYLLANLAIGGNWAGPPDSDFTSTNLKVDFIHAYAVDPNTTDVAMNDSILALDQTGLRHVIQGGPGDDTLTGTGDGDVLIGGAGDDILKGKGDSDLLSGGAGADHFVFSSPQNSTVTTDGQDQILDFSHAQGDKIDLSPMDANTNTPADDAFHLVTWFTKTPGELVEKARPGGYLVQGDVNGDGVADFGIFVHTDTPLTAGDFIL